jgi:hypothetical protein
VDGVMGSPQEATVGSSVREIPIESVTNEPTTSQAEPEVKSGRRTRTREGRRPAADRGDTVVVTAPAEVPSVNVEPAPVTDDKPVKAKAIRKAPVRKVKAEVKVGALSEPSAPASETSPIPEVSAPKKPRATRTKKEAPVSEPVGESKKSESPQTQESETTPPRKGGRSGWWKRLLDSE